MTGELGPLMLDLEGPRIGTEDRRRLLHPMCGGVILFTRNYENPEQLAALCHQIHALRTPALLIAVDHEGGRVQRFRDGFTRLPPMRALGSLWQTDPQAAAGAAREIGFLIAAELGACGVDFSFTPVLDLDYGRSGVIGDRALHRDPDVVAALAGALVDGLHDGGMAAVGKHFPGHGYAEADSHLDLPEDNRSLEQLLAADLVPFSSLADKLDGIMPAHVVFPKVAAEPAGFSTFWLRRLLRQRFGFRGVIFSDDLTMEGARAAGDIGSRVRAARTAGCDMLLVCNDPAAADQALDALSAMRDDAQPTALSRLSSSPVIDSRARLASDSRYRTAVETAHALSAGEPLRHG